MRVRNACMFDFTTMAGIHEDVREILTYIVVNWKLQIKLISDSFFLLTKGENSNIYLF